VERARVEPARTLLLTNGVGTTERFWRHLVAAFAGEHRVLHWDYRGHGASDRSKGDDYALRSHVADLVRVTEAIMARGGPAPVHVGFSMGVTVLLELYRARPDLVSALILIGGPADAPYAKSLPMRVPGVRPALSASMRLFAPAARTLGPVLNTLTTSRAAYPLARFLRLVQPSAPREDIDAFALAFAEMDPLAFWASAASLMAAQASDVLPTVKVPVLVIGAGRDLFVPTSQVEELAAKIPRASYVRVDAAGHCILIEAGPAVVAAMRDFLVRDVSLPPTR
jgi:pimeloyl-ACP methyl ester carboxylesterase